MVYSFFFARDENIEYYRKEVVHMKERLRGICTGLLMIGCIATLRDIYKTRLECAYIQGKTDQLKEDTEKLEQLLPNKENES